MEMIAKFLRQFLMHNDLAYIPGLGIFEAQNLKAELDPGTKKMAPPVRSVKFRQQTSKDASFIDFLARIEGKSPDETKKALKKWVDGLKKEIVAQKKVEIEGLGFLGLNSAKKVTFKALPDLNLSPDTIGMEPVKAEPIATRKTTEKTEAKKTAVKKEAEKVEKEEPKKTEPVKAAVAESKKEEPKKVVAPVLEEKKEPVKPVKEEAKPKVTKEPEEKKKNPMTLVLIIIGILILFSFAAYYFLNNMDMKPEMADEVKQETVEEAPAEEPEPEPEPEVKEETEPETKAEPQSITISEKSGRYYVIANSFEVEQNAYKFREAVAAQGAENARIILPDNKIRLYRVSIAEADNLEAAVQKMEDLQASFGNTIWVLIY